MSTASTLLDSPGLFLTCMNTSRTDYFLPLTASVNELIQDNTLNLFSLYCLHVMCETGPIHTNTHIVLSLKVPKNSFLPTNDLVSIFYQSVGLHKLGSLNIYILYCLVSTVIIIAGALILWQSCFALLYTGLFFSVSLCSRFFFFFLPWRSLDFSVLLQSTSLI